MAALRPRAAPTRPRPHRRRGSARRGAGPQTPCPRRARLQKARELAQRRTAQAPLAPAAAAVRRCPPPPPARPQTARRSRRTPTRPRSSRPLGPRAGRDDGHAGEEAASEPERAVGHAHNREPGFEELRVLGEPRLGAGVISIGLAWAVHGLARPFVHEVEVDRLHELRLLRQLHGLALN